MNWDAMGAIGETLGALAVFITLGYLAVQVRHAKDAVRLSTRQAASTHQLELMGMANQMLQSILANRDYASLLVKLKSDEPLSEIEQQWLDSHVLWAINFWQATQRAHDLDLLPEGFFETQCADVEKNLAKYRQFREAAKTVLSSYYPTIAGMPIFRPILDPSPFARAD
jgi:hypothetical protein